MKSINSTGEHLPLSGVVISTPTCRGSQTFPPTSARVIRSAALPWILSPLVLLLLCLVNGLWPEFSTIWSPVPFLISIFVLGMPHGASDFAQIGEFFGVDDRKNRILFSFLYFLGMGLVLLASLTAPGLSLIGFAVISVWHFGRSDLYSPKLAVPPLFFIASRGLLLLSLPIAAQPGPVQELVNGWMSILEGEVLSDLVWYRVISTSTLIAGISITSSILLIALFGLHRDFVSFRRELLETAVLVLTLLFLDPVFALGAYFLFWHSLRNLNFHSGRNILSVSRIREWCGLDRRRSILFIPTLAAYIGASLFLFDSWRPDLQVALLLIFFAVVTPSHEILQAILQRSRRRGNRPAPD